jgi:hypothetical protein
MPPCTLVCGVDCGPMEGRIAIVLSMLAGAGAAADTEIHRCLLEDGTIAFQETPCPEPAVDVDDGGTPAADDDDFVSPPAEPKLPEALTQDRADCEKTTRDAIDAIDLEMRTGTYTKEQGKEYLAELLALTKQLRACKQL